MDEFYMNRVLSLAKKGMGFVNPNPLVGAIIVKDGKIIGEGYHKAYGQPHGEVEAFLNAKDSVEGATIFVNLEPCSHYGKTPPCSDLIIKKKIKEVVIGMVDPNPLVSGKGIEKLRKAGIKVRVGILEESCKKLNEGFIKYITKKEPFFLLKSAISLDGKIATYNDESMWITGEKAREEVQYLRKEYSAILVGIETVIKDNPRLNCRIEGGRNPIKIVVDSNLRIPLDCYLIKNIKESKLIVATTERAEKEKIEILEKLGVEVLIIKERDNRVDLKELSKALYQLKIDKVLVEGGGTLNYSAIESGLIDKVIFYIAPKIIGGKEAKTAIEGVGIKSIKDVFRVKELKLRTVGEDVVIEGYIEKRGIEECLQE